MTTDNVTKTLRDFAESAKKIMRVPALKGHLGGVDFYTITLTLGEVPRYIVGTDPNLPPQLRENRRASPQRFKEIAKYMVLSTKTTHS